MPWRRSMKPPTAHSAASAGALAGDEQPPSFMARRRRRRSDVRVRSGPGHLKTHERSLEFPGRGTRAQQDLGDAICERVEQKELASADEAARSHSEADRAE